MRHWNRWGRHTRVVWDPHPPDPFDGSVFLPSPSQHRTQPRYRTTPVNPSVLRVFLSELAREGRKHVRKRANLRVTVTRHAHRLHRLRRLREGRTSLIRALVRHARYEPEEAVSSRLGALLNIELWHRVLFAARWHGFGTPSWEVYRDAREAVGPRRDLMTQAQAESYDAKCVLLRAFGSPKPGVRLLLACARVVQAGFMPRFSGKLRRMFARQMSQGSSTDVIKRRLLAIPGVTEVRVYDPSPADCGPPPRDIEIVVEGGDRREIAAALHETLPFTVPSADIYQDYRPVRGLTHRIRLEARLQP